MVLDSEDPSTWHLPIDGDHIDAAMSMFGRETHGSPEDRAKAARKIVSAARTAGIDAGQIKDFEAKCATSVHNADFDNGWVEIYRAGTYPPQNGWNGSATIDDLNRVVRNYEPAKHEAPVVVGHPRSDLPAYGWADRLMVNGDALLAKFKEVDPDFEQLVKAGKFKKRSAAFYLDAEHKISGLRHVGFLGAQPPGVKGLKNIKFDDHGCEFAEVIFNEGETEMEKTIPEQVRESITAFFVERFGGKKNESGAAVGFSEADVQRIAAAAVTDAVKPFQEKVTKLEADLKDQSVKFAEQQSSLAAVAVSQRAVEAINGLKAKGLWVPAFDKMGGQVLFEELAKIAATVEFGEPDSAGKKPKVTPLEVMVTFMEGLPKIVPGGRVVNIGDMKARGTGTGDPLTDLATARSKDKNISFSEALTQVAGENPELANAVGGARAAAV